MPRCVAIGCNNYGTHKFPNNLRLKKLWEKAMKIQNSKTNSRLCRDHFKESDFQGISPATGLPQVHRFLKKTAIPSILSPPAAVSAREQRYIKRSSRKELFPCTSQQVENVTPILTEECPDNMNNTEQGTQMPITKNVTTASQTPHMFRLLNDELLSDAKSVLYYTGLENIDKFNLVLSTLLPMAHHLIYRGSQILNVSVEDQFLLMLIKLRRNREDFELAKIFGISVTEVGNIFVTWVNFVYQLWSQIDLWPSRDLVDYYMPQPFRQHHPRTRVIVDSTEIPITKPRNPTSQQATFSSYKHHNTIKFLVGATPGGLLSFCSEGYAGSTSDRQLTERSNLLTLCDDGDSIMADRGFIVQDLFEHKNITINTPSFLKGLNQLPGVKLRQDRNLARNRIHIERLIGLTKTYKILKSDVNPYYVPLLSRIFFICVFLSNFKEGIVKNK